MPPHFGQPELMRYIALNARAAVMRWPHSLHCQSRGAFFVAGAAGVGGVVFMQLVSTNVEPKSTPVLYVCRHHGLHHGSDTRGVWVLVG